MHQGRKYKLFNQNIIPKGPFPSDRDSQGRRWNHRQMYKAHKYLLLATNRVKTLGKPIVGIYFNFSL